MITHIRKNVTFWRRYGLFLFLFKMKDVFAVVIPAFGANVVRADARAAMRASSQARHAQFEMGATQSFSRFAGSSLRDCHKIRFLSFFLVNYKGKKDIFNRYLDNV